MFGEKGENPLILDVLIVKPNVSRTFGTDLTLFPLTSAEGFCLFYWTKIKFKMFGFELRLTRFKRPVENSHCHQKRYKSDLYRQIKIGDCKFCFICKLGEWKAWKSGPCYRLNASGTSTAGPLSQLDVQPGIHKIQPIFFHALKSQQEFLQREFRYWQLGANTLFGPLFAEGCFCCKEQSFTFLDLINCSFWQHQTLPNSLSMLLVASLLPVFA